MDDPLGSEVPAAEAVTPLVALALDSSDRRESGAGFFGTGYESWSWIGVLLRGTSDSSIISLLLPGFFDIFVEMLPQ